MKIEENGHVKDKPCFLIHSKQVIKSNPAFGHKKLCDGLTFTAGHACAFSCAYCYVPASLARNKRILAIKKKGEDLRTQDFVVEIANAPVIAREYLTVGGDLKTPRFDDPSDKRVIFASPLVDVAGNMGQVKVTVAICLEILELTHWQIRLLSKNSLLREVAKRIPTEFKQRMIYGLSTGTLDAVASAAIEKGTALVGKRLETLHWLQDNSYRTYGMICPILPQKNESAYRAFAEQAVAQINLEKCEHVWAEVLNPRGASLHATSTALRQAGRIDEADLLDRVVADKDAKQEYAMQTFLAMSRVIPADKLRFLQYTTKEDEFERWEQYQECGAVLLGMKLADTEKTRLAVVEAVIKANLKQFVEVVLAFKEIKDTKLYREYGTFENYCREKFDFGRAQGYRLLAAAEVIADLQKLQNAGGKAGQMSPNGDILLPQSESQARELARIKPKGKRLEVLKLAAKKAGHAPVNAALIREAAAEIAPSPMKTKPAAPEKIKIDLKGFLGWIEILKAFAAGDNKEEVLRLLDKAATDKTIAPEPELNFAAFVNPHRPAANPNPQIHLYGRKNEKDVPDGERCYWTDFEKWFSERKAITGSEPFCANVTSDSTDPFFRELSPMLIGPVDCYREKRGGEWKSVTAISIEVAWQFSKVYREITNEETGELEDVSHRFITTDAEGKQFPSEAWFAWRDAAYNNPCYRHDHPEFDVKTANGKSPKMTVRHPFPTGSKIAFWYWGGKILDSVQARQHIYATLYGEQVVKLRGFKLLREAFASNNGKPGCDLKIFDRDGYDWASLGMTPEDCVRAEHSFGHGMVIAFLLKGIDPTNIVPKLKLNWCDNYDRYRWMEVNQPKMIPPEKEIIEGLGVKILGLTKKDAAICWGVAHPPGRFAATVISINQNIQHKYSKPGKKMALKIFKTNEDTRKESPRLVKFHNELRKDLPGLPTEYVQEVFHAGNEVAADGLAYDFLIQEWIEGETLEDMLNGKIERGDVLKMLDDLFGQIVIPLWAAGTAFWDIRDSNYVFTPDKRLMMIDSDTVVAFAEEITAKPAVYERRNIGKLEAMKRYAMTVSRMTAACLGVKSAAVQTQVKDLFATHLDKTFCQPYPDALGRDWKQRAGQSYRSFRADYDKLLASSEMGGGD
ncbi:MAG: hypothetical protein ABSF38_03945 [Verrucomicrobiota bacterium]